MKKDTLDPLFRMFEYFLVTRTYDDSNAFTKQLAEQYLAYLDSTPAHVPFHIRTGVLQDLETEVHELLVKKMYGCVKPPTPAHYGKVARVRQQKKNIEVDFIPPLGFEQPRQ